MHFLWLKNQVELFRRKMGVKHVFMIGDRIKYPHHGTGTITAIESFKGGHFYSIEMDKFNMKILVPMEKMRSVGAVYLKPKV